MLSIQIYHFEDKLAPIDERTVYNGRTNTYTKPNNTNWKPNNTTNWRSNGPTIYDDRKPNNTPNWRSMVRRFMTAKNHMKKIEYKTLIHNTLIIILLIINDRKMESFTD